METNYAIRKVEAARSAREENRELPQKALFAFLGFLAYDLEGLVAGTGH
jgi:hypothetical protein